MKELLSKDPKYVPVSDLVSYQQGLVDTGYLPPTYQPTGNWDTVSAAADRRASRDSFASARGGGGFMAGSVQSLFRYLGYTVPTSVFEGMYGIATGIVKDFTTAVTHPVEVFEEGGFAGGAAVGAGIGAIAGNLIPIPGVGAGIGAAVGAGIGGVAGFFGDLFDDDEDEGGTWQQIVGALSPIDEIRSGDAKNLFAALSTIMTASAILKAGSVAKAGIAGAGGVGRLTTREGFKMAARGDVAPGLLNQFTQFGLKRRMVGSAMLGGTANAAPEVLQGDFGQAVRDFGSGALIGALAGPALHKLGPTKAAIGKVQAGLQAAPLARVMGSDAGKIATALYTGATTPTIVARGIAEISGKSGTAIGEQIEKAPDLGTAGTVIDWTLGAVIYPNRLLPWKGQDVSQAFHAMGSNHALIPLARHNMLKADGSRISFRKSMQEVKDKLGVGPGGTFDRQALGAKVTDYYLQHAIDIEVERRLVDKVSQMKTKNPYDRLLKENATVPAMQATERAKIKQQVIEELGGTGKGVDHSPLANEMFNRALSDAAGMENHLASKGYNFDHAVDEQKAQAILNSATSETRGKDGVYFTTAVKDEYQTAQLFERFGGKGKEVGDYEAAAEAYKRARADMDNPQRHADPEQLGMAVGDAGGELDKVLLEMKKRGLIDADIYDNLRPRGDVEPLVEKKLITYLKDAAKDRPREVKELSDQLTGIADGRYIAIATGENMLDFTHFQNQAAIEGLDVYSTGFRDALASLGKGVDVADKGKMRYRNIVVHLDNVANQVLKNTDGKGAADAIYDALKRRIDKKYAEAHGEKLEVSFGGLLKRTNVETDKVKRELFKVDPRDLSNEDIIDAFSLHNSKSLADPNMDPYVAAARIKAALHKGASFGADLKGAFTSPMSTARGLAANMRVSGLPAFNDFMRTTNVLPEKMLDRVPMKFKKGSYGYLPQHARRAHMAVQFSLSPSFDLSRYIEAMMFGKMRGGDIPIKVATAPKKWIHEEGGIHPVTGKQVKGKEAVEAATEFVDRVVYNRAINQNFDELQMRLLNAGIFGFKPREVETAQAWALAQKKLHKGPITEADYAEIREQVLVMGQYGSKVSPLAASAHFVFFPFLFSRKQLSAMVDFSLGAPSRNLMIHEGFRRWYEVTGEDGKTMSEDFSKFMNKHIPIASELGRLNNLAYGISPGRFFLEGMADKNSLGKATQALSSFFLPGGVHQPIADTTGALANLFTPVVLVDDGTQAQGLLGLLERLIPAYRDLDRWFMDSDRYGTDYGLVGAQTKALSGGGTPVAQMGEYLDAKRLMGNTLEAVAQNSGYESWESLRSASPELAKMANDLDLSLGADFPEGKRLAQEFTNRDEIKEQTLYDLGNKENKTDAELAISVIGNIEVQAKQIAAQTGRTQEETLRTFAPFIRAYALKYVADRQFMNLWDGLGFRSMYGPVRQVEVA